MCSKIINEINRYYLDFEPSKSLSMRLCWQIKRPGCSLLKSAYIYRKHFILWPFYYLFRFLNNVQMSYDTSKLLISAILVVYLDQWVSDSVAKHLYRLSWVTSKGINYLLWHWTKMPLRLQCRDRQVVLHKVFSWKILKHYF